MKKPLKIILIAVIICLLLLWPKTENSAKFPKIDFEWITSKKAIVAWEAPTQFEAGTAIPLNHQLRYKVFIKISGKSRYYIELLTPDPIAATSYNLDSISHRGHYYIGVQAIAYKVKDGEIYDYPLTSKIAWSFNSADTQDSPFGVTLAP